ncbi:MAG: (Fe-S)-binding protein, partial [Candidatus Acidiferrales bacterium]
TYRLWGREADSPRGRIRQIALVDQGRLEIAEPFFTHMDRCLDCRACETACPSGVDYGKLIELARAQIQQNYKRPFFSRLARDLVYRWLLPHPRRIAGVARLARLYQRSGLESLARGSGILRLLGLQERAMLMPLVDSEFFYSSIGATFPALGEKRARVAFFAGCLAQVTFAELNRATVRVLQANGCEVVVPAQQNCCGALPAHAGVRDVARDLARENCRAFRSEDFDAIITNAAGCGSTLKEYAHLFPAGDAMHQTAAVFAPRAGFGVPLAAASSAKNRGRCAAGTPLSAIGIGEPGAWQRNPTPVGVAGARDADAARGFGVFLLVDWHNVSRAW